MRTSESDPIRVDFLDLPGVPGRIGLTFAPGKRRPGRWARNLHADLDRLVQEFGVTHLVSLIENHELREYSINELYPAAKERGITVERFPIRDVDVPPDLETVATLVARVRQWADQGHTVAIQCIGGLGRTGTIAGCILVDYGLEPRQALATVRRVRRDDRAPETPEQREFVRRFARRHRRSSAARGETGDREHSAQRIVGRPSRP